jgi:hypothetical protein
MRCETCKKNIEETFLKKKLGTAVKDEKGKKHWICSECQGKLKTKEEIIAKL